MLQTISKLASFAFFTIKVNENNNIQEFGDVNGISKMIKTL